jgi:hypothetical protein
MVSNGFLQLHQRDPDAGDLQNFLNLTHLRLVQSQKALILKPQSLVHPWLGGQA